MKTVEISAGRNRTRAVFVFALVFWGVSVLIAAYFGMYARLSPRIFGPLVVMGIVLPVLFYYRNARFQAFIVSIEPLYLTVFHLWRIPAGLTFLYYGSRHLLPPRFVENAGYGDIAVGLLVPIILLMRGNIGKYIVFDVLSLCDFVVAVGTGMTLTLLQAPLMQNIREFPVVMIPMYGVCVTGALSVMALDSILKKQRTLTAAARITEGFRAEMAAAAGRKI